MTAGSTNLYGNNWLLVADWAVRALPNDSAPFAIQRIIPNAVGNPAIHWTGTYGFDYSVEYAVSMDSWTNGLPGGTYTGILSTTSLVYQVTGDAESRSYRIRRQASP